jgi:hypothetical protein
LLFASNSLICSLSAFIVANETCKLLDEMKKVEQERENETAGRKKDSKLFYALLLQSVNINGELCIYLYNAYLLLLLFFMRL